MNIPVRHSLCTALSGLVFLFISVCPKAGAQVPGLTTNYCVTRAVPNTSYISGKSGSALWMPKISTNLIFLPDPGTFTEYNDGTATLSGTVRSITNLTSGFNLNITLTGFSATPPPDSPKKDLDSSAYVNNGGPVDPATWHYYTNFTGTLTGFGIFGGSVLQVVRYGPSLQVGVGASGKNVNFGLGAWFTWYVQQPPTVGSFPSTGRGDFNMDLGACECPVCDLLYPFSGPNPLTSVGFSESEVLRQLSPGPLGLDDTIKVWYNDEEALVLGMSKVVIRTSSTRTTNVYDLAPTPSSPGTVYYPKVGATDLTGDQAGTDVAKPVGRPMFPALFLTDLTTNSNPLAGDWQFGGTAIPPHAVFGTWKGAVRTIDKRNSPPTITVDPENNPPKNDWNLGPDADPVPPGLVNEGFGAEIRWNVRDLGLIPGHTYRAQVMVHDGDQNKSGGDAGQACVTICVVTCAPPAIVGPSDLVVPCGSAMPTNDPRSVRVLSGDPLVRVTWVGDTLTTNGCAITMTRVYQAANTCGVTRCTQTIVQNNAGTTHLTCYPSITNECGGPLNFRPPLGTNYCGSTILDIPVLSTVTNLETTCPLRYSVVRTWGSTNDCSTPDTCSQTIFFADTTPPLLTCELNLTVECGTRWAFVPPTGFDNCDGTNVTVTPMSTMTNALCGNTFTAQRVWRGADRCGNSTTITQTVAVIDTTPPVIACATNLVVQCGSAWEFATPGAYDICDGTNVTMTVLTVTNQNGLACPTNMVLTRTWRAADQCSNLSTCRQTITLIDTTAPVLTCGSNFVIECGLPLVFTPPAVKDNCDTNLVAVVVSTVTNTGLACPLRYSVTRTWSATDHCGNSNTCNQTITIRDTLPPGLVCGADQILECGTTWAFSRPVAFDLCDGANVTITTNGTVTNLLCGRTFRATRTWTATDTCGNSTNCSQTVTLVDTIPPLMTCATNLVVQWGTAWNFTTPSAYDICDGANVILTLLGTITNTSGACPTNMVMTRMWRAADQCSNLSTCSQTITLIDTTAPVLTCGSNFVIECGLPLVFTPPAVNDNCDTNLVPVVVSTTTNTGLACPLRYSVTRTWSATDRCGNSNTCNQTITVRDTTPPVITCASNLVVECGIAWSFTTPSAYDICDGINVTITVASTATNFSLTCPGMMTVTRTWQATDRCINTATCSQTVTVQDTLAPALVCGADQVIECGTAWAFSRPVAFDICAGTNVTITTNGTVTNLLCGHTYSATRTWKATDPCGNFTNCSQTITLRDTTKPLISCVATQTVQWGTTWSFTPASAYDICDGSLPVSVVSTVTNLLTCPYRFSIVRTWVATDLCANSNTCTQTVLIVDTIPPEIVCGPTRAVDCDAPIIFDPPVAYDLCDGTIVPVVVSTVSNVVASGYTLTRTWRAVDFCSNTSMCSQVIMVTNCPPSILVTIDVGCLLPGDTVGTLSSSARGMTVAGGPAPAFCYRIVVSNSSSITLTNCTVSDDTFGDLTPLFFPSPGTLFPPHATLTHYIKTNWLANVTNIVTARGQSEKDGTPASSYDTTFVNVILGSMYCEAVAYSPDDQDGVPNDAFVTLPDDGQPHVVAFYMIVHNTGEADLTNLRISTPALSTIGCFDSLSFTLSAHTSRTNTLCIANLSCTPTGLSLSSTLGAELDESNGICDFDILGRRMASLAASGCEMGVRACVPVSSCRVTGGGRQETTYPAVSFITHGGQVGAPVGMAGFDPDSECIHGNWEVVRHESGGTKGNFHAKSFDSLLCACLTCANSAGVGGLVGDLCNPNDTDCGPGPRKAPANKIAFSGVGDFTSTSGNRVPRSVLFRVDIEDRGEPGNTGKGKNGLPDRHRIRIWILTDSELIRLSNSGDRLLDMRRAISITQANVVLQDGAIGVDGLAVPNGTQVFGVRPPDIDDGGATDTGNLQIHPTIKSCF